MGKLNPIHGGNLPLAADAGSRTPRYSLGAGALLLGSVGALLHVVFQSRCTRISICFGLWSCDRRVTDTFESEPELESEPEPEQP